jgi:hypothetical protein
VATPRQRFKASQRRTSENSAWAEAQARYQRDLGKWRDWKAPARPPSGYYDPTIDQQVQAGARGLGDLRIDIDTAKRRGGEDRDTTLADLMTGENRARADAGIATGNLQTGYKRLATGQAQAGRVRGLGLSEGLADRAAGIRAANQQHDQAGIDLSLGRALENIDFQRRDLNRNFDRQFALGGDLDLQLARGEREQPLLEADANNLRLYQAKQANYVPPLRPKKPKRPVLNLNGRMRG